MDVSQNLPESVAFLHAFKKRLDVGSAPVLPVFLRESQELEAVQCGSQVHVCQCEVRSAQPQLTPLTCHITQKHTVSPVFTWVKCGLESD